MHTGLKELIIAGGPILAGLTLLSIYSLAVIWERWNYYKNHLAGGSELIGEVKKHLSRGEDKKALDACKRHKISSVGDILAKTILSEGTRSERRDYADSLIDWHMTQLQRRLTALATIGSTSPFIGLFGTVLGVMRAFRDLSSYAGAGPSVVAAGIAEALVNTAAGLFVAIPAIFAYNYFVSKATSFGKEIELTCEEIILADTSENRQTLEPASAAQEE